uniref:dUTP diphosphatase n=1 Tax=viral metagenome TaxID=1070528 RepID=A0A6C0IHH0_9ZZZZ
MTESFYRLELCPNPDCLQYYESYTTENRSNENAGVDLYSVEDYKVSSSFDERHNPAPKAVHLLNLGTRARLVKVTPIEEVDAHYWLLPRSSIYKSGIMMANSVGVIDASYRGTLMAPVTNLNEHTYPNVSKGTRLFQIVAPNMGYIKEIKIVSSLSETSRGAGGFGSTGST